MRLPRPRFTIASLMVLVVIASLVWRDGSPCVSVQDIMRPAVRLSYSAPTGLT